MQDFVDLIYQMYLCFLKGQFPSCKNVAAGTNVE